MEHIARDITELVGRTPLLEAARFGKARGLSCRLLAKLEYLNPDQAVRRIPVLRMLTRPAEEVRQEAEILADEIRKKRREKYGEKCREIPVQVTVVHCAARALPLCNTMHKTTPSANDDMLKNTEFLIFFPRT